MVSIETKRVWLAEAEKALHALETGRKARVLVDQSGERIEYTLTSSARLRSYIEQLKIQLGLSMPSRPMGFWL